MYSGFFDNTEVVSEDFARLVSGIVTNGVLDDNGTELKVTAGSGMNVSVAPGYCWIEGHFGRAETAETLAIDTASGSVGRIDRVVARCDYEAHKVYLTVIKGEEGETPTPPPIVRDGTYYDLGLATVSVPAGTIEITDSLITDTRADSSVCGGCLMRTGVVLDLAGKADKTELEAANQRIDKNAEDIAAQTARGMTRKTFSGGSGEAAASSYTLGVPGDMTGAAVVEADGTAEVRREYDDTAGNHYTENYSFAFKALLIGIGDSQTVSDSQAYGTATLNIKLADSGIQASISTAAVSKSTITRAAITVNAVKGVFLT
ncbi:MAG: hypothetical protein ACI4KR_12135 [Ruminiclostridium sp.]